MLNEYLADFVDIGARVASDGYGNIILEDVAVPWRPVEIMVYASHEEFCDCFYEDVCNYLACE